jgi:hypothetical protein
VEFSEIYRSPTLEARTDVAYQNAEEIALSLRDSTERGVMSGPALSSVLKRISSLNDPS